MEIPEKLLEYRFHIIFALALPLTIVSIVHVAPSFVPVLAYFWPLFLSTALFLFAVIFFGRTSVKGIDVHGDDKAVEGLIDYVAGQPEHSVESFKSE
ncbi:hypothetical protein I3843_12G136500 [Carya illinoinensis]|uniref:Uncharacterized protein n=1 Tax=Carya illinoinensis TaxID=32201 RepID=A0A8T1NYN6_CARIL|nr:uncharacterized protein LOC122289850 [Carya illinoinensis]KAG2678239.1 hypothetical protein I3760_12G134300 [Carya illinoinensis]KAG6634731.1 hypothetical protein CIPAW_12G137500 [Carya illinoinensis]KAG6685922.1 hypothetical protein I3842_12G136200 [Carya illinoinensis]KAG7953962.1 hypothetical protein I3843_12G136500 [Carya illinoinensis]